MSLAILRTGRRKQARLVAVGANNNQLLLVLQELVELDARFLVCRAFSIDAAVATVGIAMIIPQRPLAGPGRVEEAFSSSRTSARTVLVSCSLEMLMLSFPAGSGRGAQVGDRVLLQLGPVSAHERVDRLETGRVVLVDAVTEPVGRPRGRACRPLAAP